MPKRGNEAVGSAFVGARRCPKGVVEVLEGALGHMWGFGFQGWPIGALWSAKTWCRGCGGRLRVLRPKGLMSRCRRWGLRRTNWGPMGDKMHHQAVGTAFTRAH